MSIAKSEMKEEALKRMRILNLSSKTVEAFTETGEVRLSMNGVLYLSDSEKGKSIQKFEGETGCMVYHMIYNHTAIGNLLTFLYVSAYPEEWEQDRSALRDGFPLAYVVNEDDKRFSEFGSVGIKPVNGAVIRTA